MVGGYYNYSHRELLEYAESLIKESRIQESRQLHNNYSWLKSRDLQLATDEKDLEELKPMIRKMTSESCAVIAVKLDSLEDVSSNVIIATLKRLLEEQQNIQLISSKVKCVKETGSFRKKLISLNKVHPVLLPTGRQPTVSFVCNK